MDPALSLCVLPGTRAWCANRGLRGGPAAAQRGRCAHLPGIATGRRRGI